MNRKKTIFHDKTEIKEDGKKKEQQKEQSNILMKDDL